MLNAVSSVQSHIDGHEAFLVVSFYVFDRFALDFRIALPLEWHVIPSNQILRNDGSRAAHKLRDVRSSGQSTWILVVGAPKRTAKPDCHACGWSVHTVNRSADSVPSSCRSGIPVLVPSLGILASVEESS
jgi:hypothetical protein